MTIAAPPTIESTPGTASISAPLRVAVLVACYNRYGVTRAALASLFEATATIDAARLTVFLLDDASPDLTGARISAEWPDVRLTHGDGTLFWNRGMHRLIEVARAAGHFDAFMLLNDDVRLIAGRLKSFLTCYRELVAAGPPVVLIGAMADPVTGVITYSGMRRTDAHHPLRLAIITPEAQAVPCDAANGNLMLVPNPVMAAVGNLDLRYRHAIGDVDICYRAARAGYGTMLAPGVYGWCGRNDIVSHTLERPSIKQRYRFFFGPKIDPMGFTTFFRQHAPGRWRRYALRMWLWAAIGTVSPWLHSRVWPPHTARVAVATRVDHSGTALR